MSCAHAERVEGVCTACGDCLHEVVLNGACFLCGTTELGVEDRKSKPPALIEADRLVRKKP